MQTPEIRPEWIDLPRNGEKCHYSKLKRKALDFLTRPQERNNYNPPVKSRVLTQGGKGQWRRMIHYQSLMDYIESLAVELEETARKQAALAHQWTKARYEAAAAVARTLRERMRASRVAPDCGLTVKEWLEILAETEQRHSGPLPPLGRAAPKLTVEPAHLSTALDSAVQVPERRFFVFRFSAEDWPEAQGLDRYRSLLGKAVESMLGSECIVSVEQCEEPLPGPDPVLKQQWQMACDDANRALDILEDLEAEQEQRAFFAKVEVTDDNRQEHWNKLRKVNDAVLEWVIAHSIDGRLAGMAKKILNHRRMEATA
jgi:hypothetical protein